VGILKDRVQHYALIYPKKFKAKPDVEVGKIHNYFKRNPYSKPYTLRQITNAFCSGQTLMLAMTNLELKRASDKEKADTLDKQSSEWADLHKLGFISTQLVGIDIDDVYSHTDIQKIIKHFKGRLAAVYYSFSHQKPNDKGGVQTRYRLLFQFDKPITDYDTCKEIVKLIKLEILEMYPDFPVDKIDTMQPKTLWHGSSRPVVYLDEAATMSLGEYTIKVKQALEDRKIAYEANRKNNSKRLKNQTENSVTFEELLEMAKVIGHIPSGTGRFEEWRNCSLAIRSHEAEGHISEGQALQIFDVISGGEGSDKDFFNFNPNGLMTIGTFIKQAIEAGYKRKHKYLYALQETLETIDTETINVNGYLPTKTAKELLQRQQRLLIDSPTGSGKSTSFVEAFKELVSHDDVNDSKHYIITLPTIALTEQLAKKHDIPAIRGGMTNIYSTVTTKALEGVRIWSTTFDKANELVNYLNYIVSEQEGIQPQFYLVIDEIHKFSEAYNYRFAAIDKLKELINIAECVIGLSGTPEDILKDQFDKLIKINTGNNNSPCLDYRVFTYDKAKDADVMLISLVRGLLKQTRVLLFINNKDRIKLLASLLRKEKINTQIVTSNNKKSKTYLNIVENEAIDEEVQVILATSVIADGISIKNSLNWSCIVVCDKSSPIYNPSTIKQMSNRFRKEYRYFGIYMQKPNPEYSDLKRFNVEAEYQYRKRVVSAYTDYLNAEFEAVERNTFTPSEVERANGIYYKNDGDIQTEILFNPLFIRHQSMKRKENYYRTFRDAFIKEIAQQIGKKLTGIFNVNEAVATNGIDLSKLFEEVEAIQEEDKREAAEKRAAFTKFFDEPMYDCFVLSDSESLAAFKMDVHPDQYSSVMINHRLADYETCKTIGENLKRKTDIRKYYNDIRALTDIASFDYVKKINVTKRVYTELLKMVSFTYVSADFKHLIEEQLPKKLKVRTADVKDALKLFHKQSSRTSNGAATTEITPLDIEVVAWLRHNPPKTEMLVGGIYGIKEDAVKKSIRNYVYQKSQSQQKILLPAVAKRWGIQGTVNDDFFTLNY